jgi:hypothetical protein
MDGQLMLPFKYRYEAIFTAKRPETETTETEPLEPIESLLRSLREGKGDESK